MQSNCPACGAPITDNSKFCSHCGARLADNEQKITIEDKAKLEEIRLKYELEERKRQENNESRKNSSKSLKIKRWVSWLVCVDCLCAGVFLHETNENVSLVFGILFMASGIYAVIITFASLFRKR